MRRLPAWRARTESTPNQVFRWRYEHRKRLGWAASQLRTELLPVTVAAEPALRAVALGRKNFLSCGSDAGGERAAAIDSLLETAKLNGLDPELYLRAFSNRSPINRIQELLPCNIAAPQNHLA